MRKYLVSSASLALVVILIAIGLKNHAIPMSNDPYAIFQEKTNEVTSTGFQFENASQLIESSPDLDKNNYTIFVSIADYNNDSFEDILLVNHTPSLGVKIKLLKNNNGLIFSDVTSETIQLPSSITNISAAVFVDLDKDGLKDLYIAQFMKPHFVLKNISGKFSFNNQIPIDTIIAPTRGISLFDFNNDGFLDIYLTSFSKTVYSYLFNNQDGLSEAPYPVRAMSGSTNVLLVNNHGTNLSIAPNALGLSDGGFTWAVGVADFNSDGFPDVYIANDFGYDHFYQNNQGRNFTDISKNALGNVRSENSMGAEIGDIENNGKLNIYISNASKPGMTKGWNHLWKQNKINNLTLSDHSEDFKIDKCGFTWGTKFSDLDKDGKLDLFAVNGRTGKANQRKQDNNRWLYRLYEWNIPAELKYSKYVQVPQFNFHFAQGQKNCVFLQKNNKFIDVAENVGVSDMENGRSLAVFDFNNDGQEDFLIGNLLHQPILYKGILKNKNSWIGLKLIGTKSNKESIGAKIILTTNTTSQTRIIYPTNGFQNQSTPRVIFGIPQNESINQIEIKWPSGKHQFFYPKQLERYYEFIE